MVQQTTVGPVPTRDPICVELVATVHGPALTVTLGPSAAPSRDSPVGRFTWEHCSGTVRLSPLVQSRLEPVVLPSVAVPEQVSPVDGGEHEQLEHVRSSVMPA
jgi:hypothetical protein